MQKSWGIMENVSTIIPLKPTGYKIYTLYVYTTKWRPSGYYGFLFGEWFWKVSIDSIWTKHAINWCCIKALYNTREMVKLNTTKNITKVTETFTTSTNISITSTTKSKLHSPAIHPNSSRTSGMKLTCILAMPPTWNDRENPAFHYDSTDKTVGVVLILQRSTTTGNNQ